jgi:hypothetical protein
MEEVEKEKRKMPTNSYRSKTEKNFRVERVSGYMQARNHRKDSFLSDIKKPFSDSFAFVPSVLCQT